MEHQLRQSRVVLEVQAIRSGEGIATAITDGGVVAVINDGDAPGTVLDLLNVERGYDLARGSDADLQDMVNAGMLESLGGGKYRVLSAD